MAGKGQPDMFDTLLDAAFKRAQENGDFDNLPGAGKPIPKSSMNADPFAHSFEERGVMSPLGILQRRIDAARADLAETEDPAARRALETEISALETRKAIEMETWKRYS